MRKTAMTLPASNTVIATACRSLAVTGRGLCRRAAVFLATDFLSKKYEAPVLAVGFVPFDKRRSVCVDHCFSCNDHCQADGDLEDVVDHDVSCERASDQARISPLPGTARLCGDALEM